MARYRPFKNGQFVRVCTKKMIDHQCRKNRAKNVNSNYNQMKAYCDVIQINQKNYILSTFSSSNRRNFEDFGKILAGLVPDFYHSVLLQGPVYTYTFSSKRYRSQ